MELSETDIKLSRRVVLKYAGVFAFGLLINTKQPPAQAVAVAAVVAVVQVGIALAGLFGPKGPDLAELIQAQTALLRNISEQLNALNNHLNEIDSKLDEIAQLIQQVPVTVATKLYRDEILGAIAVYGTLFKTYADIIGNGGSGAIERGRTEIRPLLESDVLAKIVPARAKLITISPYNDNQSLIPYIAAALNCEIRSMIFKRSEPEHIINVINFYREYFQKWLDPSYPNNIFDPSNRLRAERVDLINMSKVPLGGDPFLVDKSSRGCGHPTSEHEYLSIITEYHFKRRLFAFDLSPLKIEQWISSAGISKDELEVSLQMVSMGTLNSSEGFLSPTTTYSWLDGFAEGDVEEISGFSDECIRTNPAQVTLGDGVTKVYARSLPNVQAFPECKQLVNIPTIPPHDLTKLHDNTRNLVALRSLESICKDSVNICDRFTLELKALKVPI